jgi:hypothetical protein
VKRSSAQQFFTIRIVVSLLPIVLLAFACTKNECEPFPSDVIASATSPDGQAVARILEVHPGDGGGMLGTDVQLFLSIERNGTTAIITRDLSEGFGTYEGGVSGVRWLGVHRVLVKRAISDRPANIVYELNSGSWEEPARSELE